MRYLGLDLGKKKLGVAISDSLGIIASFYDNIKISSEEEMLEEVKKIIDGVSAVVILQSYLDRKEK